MAVYLIIKIDISIFQIFLFFHLLISYCWFVLFSSFIYFNLIKLYILLSKKMGIGDLGLGIGDW
jgi:hypothetical protein